MIDHEKLATFLVNLIKSAMSPIAERVKALEEREFPYKGEWQPSVEYRRGQFVTYKGSMFHCCTDANNEPPGKSTAWQLAVKGAR